MNVGAIVVGGVVGLWIRRDLSAQRLHWLKMLLALLATWIGFRMVWDNVHGSWLRVCLQIGVALVALVLGNGFGKTLGLQRQVNRLGREARARYAGAESKSRSGSRSGAGKGYGRSWMDGLVAVTIVYCAGPLAIIGPFQEGLRGDPGPLFLKAALDGLASLAFTRALGLGTLLAAGAVLVWQGSLTLLAQAIRPWMLYPGMLEGFGVGCGLIVAIMSLTILDLRKVPLADYLPAILLAPVLRAMLPGG